MCLWGKAKSLLLLLHVPAITSTVLTLPSLLQGRFLPALSRYLGANVSPLAVGA